MTRERTVLPGLLYGCYPISAKTSACTVSRWKPAVTDEEGRKTAFRRRGRIKVMALALSLSTIRKQSTTR